MKTLSEIKDEYAQSEGYQYWDELETSFRKSGEEISYGYDAVCKRYAEEAIKEAALVCREHRDSGCFDGEGAEANILNIIKELK